MELGPKKATGLDKSSAKIVKNSNLRKHSQLASINNNLPKHFFFIFLLEPSFFKKKNERESVENVGTPE